MMQFVQQTTLPAPLHTLESWLALFLTIAAALGLVKVLGAWMRATVARRWLFAHSLGRLAVGTRADRLTETLGAPSFGDVVRTWAFPEAFVVARVEQDIVTVIAVTTRRRWFRPTFRPVGLGKIRLGKTTFEELGDSPTGILGGVGARRWGYAEKHYRGNPGLYREFALGVNDAGYVHALEPSLDLARCVDERAMAHNDSLPTRWRTLRPEARINTYAVSAPFQSVNAVENSVTFGAELDVVRVLGDSDPVWLRKIRKWRYDHLSWKHGYTL